MGTAQFAVLFVCLNFKLYETTIFIKSKPHLLFFKKMGFELRAWSSGLAVALNAHALVRDDLRRLLFGESRLDERTVRLLEPLGHQVEQFVVGNDFLKHLFELFQHVTVSFRVQVMPDKQIGSKIS